MIEDALVALVRANVGITTIIGNRFYHLVLPQDAKLPAVTYEVHRRNTVKTLAGPTKLRSADYMLDIMSTVSADVRNITKLLLSLEGVQSQQAGGTTMLWLWHDDETESYDQPQQQDERGVRHVQLTITLWYTDP